ncbi:MAG: hypothetical protein EPN91_01770 [Salinibacterium sp.]|nr:MAG: hypothetical protein EPN91_01770 [Salinibacterium sp.]
MTLDLPPAADEPAVAAERSAAHEAKQQQKQTAAQIFVVAAGVFVAGVVMIFLGKWIGWLTVILCLGIFGAAARDWLKYKRMPE